MSTANTVLYADAVVKKMRLQVRAFCYLH